MTAPPPTTPDLRGVFPGETETAALAREIDWSATSLGPVEHWSRALLGAVRTAMESPFPTNLWCGDDKILVYNDGYRAVLGAKHPRALGRPGSEVWSEIWPEIESMFPAAVRGESIYAEDAHFVMERSDGPPADAWFTFSISPIRDEHGHVVAFLNVASETTDRVRAEEALRAARADAERAERRLREVFAQAPAFLAVLQGPEHRFEFTNPAYMQLVGHRDIIGRSVAETFPEVVEQGFIALLDDVYRTGKPYIGREIPIVFQREAGAPSEERILDFVYQPITDAEGKSTGILAHGTDATEGALARRELERLTREATEANRAKSDFLAAMSHELRTPLNAIGGYAQLIELGVRGPVTEEQKLDLARIQRSKDHLDALVSDVLNFAKAGSGRIDIRTQRLGVAKTLEAVLEMIMPQVREKAMHLEWPEVEPTLALHADEDRTRQILLNLIANALKFTANGGTIAVGVASTDAVVTISVRDNGIGIAPENLERIFEPFVQAGRASVASDRGVGLGLAISRQLARAMGGDLRAESGAGVGSTFTLTLPRES